MMHRLWQWIDSGVGQLSVTKTAAIGGTGSGASVLATYSAEQWSSGLQVITFGLGVVGAILSVGLLVLKWVQQNREMRYWQATVYKTQVTEDLQSGKKIVVETEQVIEGAGEDQVITETRTIDKQ